MAQWQVLAMTAGSIAVFTAAPHQAVLTKRVVHDRSVVMAFRMQRELRRGNAFVAVGALHLYGAKGVLSLLESDGYSATWVR